MSKKEIKINIETLNDNFEKDNILDIKGNKYLFRGRNLSKKEWFLETNTFSSFSKEKIKSRYIDNIHPVYQKMIFMENVNYATKIALIFPTIFFSFVSFLIILFLSLINKFNFSYSEIINLKYYFVFLLLLLVSFSFVLFFKYLLGYRMYVSKKHGRASFNHLNKDRHQEMINCFDEHINNYKNGVFLAKGDNIGIRYITIFDLFDYYQMLANKRVMKYLLNKPIKSYKGVLNKINIHLEDYKEGKYFRLAIVNNENIMIGSIGVSKLGLTNEQCEIVYGLSEKYWYQGYTVQAVKAFITFLLEKGYKKIIATHVDKNVNSGKVLLKSGFIFKKDLNRIMRYKNKNYNLIGYEYKE